MPVEPKYYALFMLSADISKLALLMASEMPDLPSGTCMLRLLSLMLNVLNLRTGI